MSWLERMQSADDGSKRKLVIAFTVLAMTVIVLVWLFVFGGPRPLPRASEGKDRADFSVWQSIRGGSAAIWENFFGREEVIKPES